MPHAMLRNFWYVACPSSQLGAAAPRAAQVLDKELVLYRDASLRPYALLDRCAHRGAKLTLGKVGGGHIACGYHGWQFDGAGQCTHIPSLVAGRRIASGCEVPAFPVVEQDSYVWVWIGEGPPRPALPAAIPDFARMRWVQGTVPMKCAALKGIENNLDWCHPFFAHPKTHGQYFETARHGFREQEYEMRVTERGLTVFSPPAASEDGPIPESPKVHLAYELPDRVSVRFGRSPTRSLRSKLSQNGRIVMHFVPTSKNTCRLEWLVRSPVPFGKPVLWSSREPKIFLQDRLLLESSQPAYDRSDDFEKSVEADASTLLARRIWELAERGAWEEGRTKLPARRVVHVRA